MTKKEYLIKLFSALEASWEPAKGLLLLVQQKDFDQELLDVLLNEVKAAVNDAFDETEKQKLQKTLSYLELLKKSEEESRLLDQQDILNLERTIQSL